MAGKTVVEYVGSKRNYTPQTPAGISYHHKSYYKRATTDQGYFSWTATYIYQAYIGIIDHQ